MSNFDFTIQKKNNYNLKIKEDLTIINNIILGDIYDVISLVLVGGFGRGEGSMLSYNNQIIPINDYDIVVISKTNILNTKINFFYSVRSFL